MVTMSAEAEPATTTTTPPKKYSRYRAVRHQAEIAKETPVIPAPQESHDASITRSMSRYRRSRAATKTDHPTSPPVPSIPPIPNHPNHAALNPYARSEGVRRATDPTRNPPKQQLPTRNDTVTGVRTHGKRETEAERAQRKARELRELEEAHRRAQKDQDERELREAKAKADQIRLDEEEKQRLLAEQKRKDLERLEAELEAAGPPLERVTSPGKEKFKIFSRKRSATKTTAHSSGSGKEGLAVSRSRSHSSPQRPSNDALPQSIDHGVGGNLPGSDAPMSAVNAGERRVLIRCKQSSINLPITPETTPMDIVYSAANIMTQNITPSSAILMECYTQLGLERRIRRYEHVRDIMNSWDRDTQNSLLLQNSDSPNYDHDLETYSVPRERPKDVTVYMYHSQKPGKWNKRYITLLSSGQIFMSKKTGAKQTDKDVISLCHLSDFDIYTPTPQQLRKVLRPPKKHCYAIKSQQKTTMFLSTENFVHFFNTDDETLSNKWYNSVQRWRSWYLVNRMGEGKKTAQKSTTELRGKLPSRPGTKAGPTHKVKVSVDEDPYTIGSFKPLMNLDRFTPATTDTQDPDHDSEEENRPRQIPFHLRNRISLSPLPSRRESKRHPPPVSYRLPPEAAAADEEFASSGLLGRTYSQRQRAHKEREAALKQNPGPFMDGPSLLNGPERPETSGGLQRSASTSRREKPKPLLDFTPQFKEAPQWDRTGKGHGVPAPTGVPLVEVATTPETGLADIPKGTVFRREGRPATSAGEGAFVKGGLVSGK